MGKIVLEKDNKYHLNRKKGTILSFIFSRVFVIAILAVLQIYVLLKFSNYLSKTNAYAIIPILDIILTIIIINTKKMNDSYKITWLMLFATLPMFGIIIYIIIKIINYCDIDNKKLRDNILQSKKYYISGGACTDYSYGKKFIEDNYSKYPHEVSEHFSDELTIVKYFLNGPELPAYINTKLKYFDNGKDAFEDILEKMQNAKKFIFIEIFILCDGIIWQEMLKILKQKAKEGVAVRLMYDGLNSISSFKHSYCDTLKKYGIDARMYKPLIPLVSNSQNRRDHRKIFVIDNEYAYTGGINIADEYANLYERFGIWKDVGIRIYGSAVESFTVMFLHMWNIYTKSDIIEYEKFLPSFEKNIFDKYDGIVIPYTDYPSCSENVSVELFRFMFANANSSISIMTPYLVLDEILVSALESAAKRGVDVKIIVPHIPDKAYVFMVNRSYYKTLTNAGVKVYEYIPGFVHAKVVIQDNIRAIVGTCNLDFRSLYLHSENGVYCFGSKEVCEDIISDFNNTLNACREMNQVEISKFPLHHKLFGFILKMFAPLL